MIPSPKKVRFRVAVLASLLSTGIAPSPTSAAEQEAPSSSSLVEILWTSEELKSRGLDPLADFVPSPWGGLVLVSGRNVVWSTAWASLVDPALPETKRPEVRQVIFTPGMGLIGISGDTALSWSEGGWKAGGQRLPNSWMAIAPNPQDSVSFFAYGGRGAGSDSIYLFTGGELRKIVQTPGTVTAFVADKESLYYAVGKMVYRQAAGQKPEALMDTGSSSRGDVLSLARDDARPILYLSTAEMVWGVSLDDRKMDSPRVIRGYGGKIRRDSGKLYLYDERIRKLVAFASLLDPMLPDAGASGPERAIKGGPAPRMSGEATHAAREALKERKRAIAKELEEPVRGVMTAVAGGATIPNGGVETAERMAADFLRDPGVRTGHGGVAASRGNAGELKVKQVPEEYLKRKAKFDARSVNAKPSSRDRGLLFTTIFASAGTDVGKGRLLGFDIGGNGALIVHSSEILRDVGAEKDILLPKTGRIESASLLSNHPLAIVEGALQIYENGQWSKLLEVSLRAPKLVSNDKSVYLTGVPSSAQGSPLFIYEKDKGYQHLIDLPESPDSLALDWQGRLIYSIGPALYSFRPGDPISQLAALAGFDRIDSIASDSENEILYLSSGQALFALDLANSSLILVLRDMGGQLRFLNGKLYLLSEGLGTVTEISGLSKALLNDKEATRELKEEPL